ncbi:MAG: PAS domain S-box protein [Mucilaginibacter sp.]
MAAENGDFSKNIDEKLFRLLVTHLQDYAIFMLDPNGYIMSWNQGAEHINGYAEEEVIGRHISMFYKKEDVRAGLPSWNLNEALKNGSHQSEGWRVRKDTTEFWADVTYATIYDDDGRLIGFAKVIRDVTERKQQDDRKEAQTVRLTQRVKDNTQKIIANELRFRQLIENSYDGITLFNYKLDVIYRSRSAERINGWTDKDIACTVFDDLVHPDDKAIYENAWARVMTEPGIPVKIAYRLKHKKGYYIWMECIYTNWLDDENINAIVGNFRDITDQVLANEEIRKKTEQVENILDSITDGFIAFDNDMRFTYANKRLGEIVGIEPKDLIGKCVWDIFPEAIGSETYKAFNKALETQRYVSVVDYYAPLDFWQENHIYPSPAGLSVFVRDITIQKHNEELQKRNQEASEMQAAILNALPPNIALLDENYKIITVNDSWKKFALDNNLGLPHYGIGYNYLAFCEHAMGMSHAEGNIVAKGIKSVVKGRRNAYSMEYLWESKAEKRWYNVTVAPLFNSNYNGAVVIHTNITDRKNAEDSLIQSEANLRSVFENTDLSIVLFDADLRIVSFNTNAKLLAIRNYGKKLTKGNSAFNYFQKSRKADIEQMLHSITNKGSFNYETTHVLSDGTTEWYDVTWMGIFNRKEENIGFILTLKDITDKKLAEMEREKMTADLVKRNADLEQFTYIISHNLRAPVANIIGLSAMLGDMEVKHTEDADTLKALNVSVNKLDDVIIDLNHILQVNSEINQKIEKIHFADIVRDITQSIGHIVKRENVTVNTDFEIDSIYTLKNYLHSIFYNLIMNSIKYHRPDVAPVIRISNFIQGDKIVIIFKDNGKGIDLEKNGKQLFGLYKRFDYSVEGKGMGLFMVKMQVESLNGSISAESMPNRGTAFRLEFPAKDKTSK